MADIISVEENMLRNARSKVIQVVGMIDETLYQLRAVQL
jgi:hypothetical protein